jgi:hypothetical protein
MDVTGLLIDGWRTYAFMFIRHSGWHSRSHTDSKPAVDLVNINNLLPGLVISDLNRQLSSDTLLQACLNTGPYDTEHHGLQDMSKRQWIITQAMA